MDIRIGKQLTQAREALGLIVEDVAHRTRIPATVVRQLESEDFSQFPNNVYAKSFLRLYSKHLGIDASPFIAEHNGQLKKREDEVAYLDGIAISPEFKPGEAITASPAAVAAVEASRTEAPAGKVSPGFMTVFLLAVVGLPTAFFLSKLWDRENEDKGPEAGGAPTPADLADSGDGSTGAETPEDDPGPEPAPSVGGAPDDVEAPAPEAAIPVSAEDSNTLNPPVDVPRALPAGDAIPPAPPTIEPSASGEPVETINNIISGE